MNSQKLFNRNFTIIAVGQFISLLGNSLQRFAFSLFILDLTGSAIIFSIIVAVTFLPQILLSPFGGAIADRFSKKWIMVILDSISGLMLLAFYFYFSNTQNISCLMIGILMFLMTIIQSIYDPDVRASIPCVTSESNLSGANSVVSIISALTNMLGPVAAGFLYGLYGIKTILLINTISFLVSAIMELFIILPFNKTAMTDNVLKVFVNDIKDAGFFLIHTKPIIFKMIVISSSLNLFLTPVYSVGMPYMEKIVFGVSDQLYGFAEGLVGAGMIIGALITSVISKKIPFEKLYKYFYAVTFSIVIMGACTLPVIMSATGPSYTSYVMFTASAFILSVAISIVNILCMTYLQKEIDIKYMGKAMALTIAMSNSLYPLGQIFIGGLYNIFSSALWFTYAIITICALVITVIMKGMLVKEFPER